MKIILKVSIILLLASFAFIAKGQSSSNKLQTVEQVKNLAKKYGLQDKLQESEFTFLKNKSENTVNDYLKTRYTFELREEAVKKFRAKTLYVRTMKDYFELIEKDPTIREIEVKIYGGEEAYKNYFHEMIKYQYRIYRDTNGALSFFKKESPFRAQESISGTRIDNLAKK
jgi:hypothetical protein